MARNKFEAQCATRECGIMLPPGNGFLHKGGRGWDVYCEEHRRRQSRDPHHVETGQLLTNDPLVKFLRENLQMEYDGSSGEGSAWFHSPRGSGRVKNELDNVIAEGERHVADHLERWDPVRAYKNIESRQLVIDLYEDAPGGSTEQSALRLALRAMAMAYEHEHGYREEWTLPATTIDEAL